MKNVTDRFDPVEIVNRYRLQDGRVSPGLLRTIDRIMGRLVDEAHAEDRRRSAHAETRRSQT